MNHLRLYSIVISFLFLSHSPNAQTLRIVTDVKQYEKVAKIDSNQRMVSIKRIQGIQFDLRYATTNNFIHQQLYPATGYTYLRLAAANALEKVQGECTLKGYSLKIFDAYRPYSISQKMWTIVHDNRYVAKPANGSAHNRGTAVDLTLTYLQTGKNVDMGTDFDCFNDSAHHSFKSLPAKVLANRKFLKTVMEKYGFKSLETEWWHYTFGDPKKYDVRDISFEELGEKL